MLCRFSLYFLSEVRLFVVGPFLPHTCYSLPRSLALERGSFFCTFVGILRANQNYSRGLLAPNAGRICNIPSAGLLRRSQSCTSAHAYPSYIFSPVPSALNASAAPACPGGVFNMWLLERTRRVYLHVSELYARDIPGTRYDCVSMLVDLVLFDDTLPRLLNTHTMCVRTYLVYCTRGKIYIPRDDVPGSGVWHPCINYQL